jgi:signal transduction histidine kinase
VQRLQRAEPGRRIEFVVQPGLAARGDARLLEIALSNLLDNGAKFTARRDDARVEVGRTVTAAPGSGAHGVFFVRDNGVGFDMAHAGKLFSPFQRMHRANEFPGSGIGLATVQRIIHRHGGRIWAESRRDRGSIFYFTLREAA